jgi:hypothetical protein
MTLNQDHTLAVLGDETDQHQFDSLIHVANEKKQNAKYAFMHHRKTHAGSAIAKSAGNEKLLL